MKQKTTRNNVCEIVGVSATKYHEHIRFYKDKRGKYRWQIKAKNGKIVGASTQGYRRMDDMFHNWKYLRDVMMSHRLSSMPTIVETPFKKRWWQCWKKN